MFGNSSPWLLIRQPTKSSRLLIISCSNPGLLNTQPANGPHPPMMSSSIPWLLISQQTLMVRISSQLLLMISQPTKLPRPLMISLLGLLISNYKNRTHPLIRTSNLGLLIC